METLPNGLTFITSVSSTVSVPNGVMCGSRGRGAGGRDPLENDKNKGFLAILVLIPSKITNLSSEHSMYYDGPSSARQQNAI